jgi:hypothetical protein
MNKLLTMAFVAALLTACAAPAPSERNEKAVFVTSVSFNSNLGGLKGADDKCQAEADGPASIVPSGTYLAWLSDGTDSPDTRFTKSTSPYLLPDGTKIAENYTDLTDGSIQHVINIDPTGKSAGRKQFWSATDSDGTSAQSFLTCTGWLDPIPLARGMVGSTGYTSTLWSSRTQHRCGSISERLVCFQQ